MSLLVSAETKKHQKTDVFYKQAVDKVTQMLHDKGLTLAGKNRLLISWSNVVVFAYEKVILHMK